MLLLTALQVLTLGGHVPPVPPVPAPQAGRPHLTHTAPFVGHTLTIRVDGAPAHVRVDLFLSPSAGTYTTPYGNLELDRVGLHEVASGITSTSGSWSIDFPIPLDTSLAETEQHFQAIVDDPSGPTGRVISDAAHLRLLGPRVYASVGESYGFPGTPALEIVSGTTESVVATVELGTGGIPASPVFEASYARGAVMSGDRELVFFDPFFGGVLQRITFPTGCAANLVTDPTRETVFVLEKEPTGRIHVIDFANGAETASFVLPNPVASSPAPGWMRNPWCEGTPGTEVYVAEMDLAGQTSVRHVSLEPFSDLGSAVVGTPLEDRGFTDLVYAAGQVFASTIEWQDPDHHFYSGGCLTRCRFRGTTIRTSAEPLGLVNMFLLTAVPEANRMLAIEHASIGPGGGLVQMPLSAAGPIEAAPLPPTGCCFYPRFMNADGKRIWAVVRDDEDATSLLFRLDLESMTWSSYLSDWTFDPPGAAELLRDAWDHEYWVANTPTTSPLTLWPEIRIVDELQSTTRHIRLDRTAFGLFAVPLP